MHYTIIFVEQYNWSVDQINLHKPIVCSICLLAQHKHLY